MYVFNYYGIDLKRIDELIDLVDKTLDGHTLLETKDVMEAMIKEQNLPVNEIMVVGAVVYVTLEGILRENDATKD